MEKNPPFDIQKNNSPLRFYFPPFNLKNRPFALRELPTPFMFSFPFIFPLNLAFLSSESRVLMMVSDNLKDTRVLYKYIY
jgi:hypothetical protein